MILSAALPSHDTIIFFAIVLSLAIGLVAFTSCAVAGAYDDDHGE